MLPVAAPGDLLQQLCHDLRQLWTEAGGPSLRTLAMRVDLGKSQLSAILNGRIRRPPDWEVVRGLIDNMRQYASEHDRLAAVSVRTGVTEYWRPRYGVLEHAFQHAAHRRSHDDPSGSVDPWASTMSTAWAPVPRQLPAAPASFTGRASELTLLTQAVDERPGSPATMPICVVGGMGGIGKTWLVLHWAHRNLDRFPHGQLFVDLSGFSPGAKASNPADVLRGFLLAFGVHRNGIPLELDDRARLFRSLVVDRRMLIILDNARDSDQLTPLLPGSSACTVLVTSRNRLTRLITAHGAGWLSVDVLPDADARDLLALRLGTSRLSAEPDAAARLLTRCAGLPLALSIITGRAQTHPLFPLADLAGELDDTSTRLSILADNDPIVSLPAVLSWSYSALPAEQAHLFGLLGLDPGPDLSLPAIANLSDTEPAHAATLLRGLEEAHLVHQHLPGRYRLHDLVKLYATDCAHRDLPLADRLDGLRRMLDFLLYTAYTANRRLAPHRSLVARIDPDPPATLYVVPDGQSAWAWFEAEHPGLLAAQRLAIEQGWYRHAWQLAWSLDHFHFRYGLLHDMVTSWQVGLVAAQHENDTATLGLAHRELGDSYSLIGRHSDAIHHLDQARTLTVGDPLTEAHNHYYLALAWARQDCHQRALEYATVALQLFHNLNQPIPEADLLDTIGLLYTRLGHYHQAATHLQAALTLHRRHQLSEAQPLNSLGYLAHHTGHYQEALDYYQQSLALHRHSKTSLFEAETLHYIGDTHAALGQHDQAHHAWQEALHLYQTQHRTQSAHRIQQQLDNLPPQPNPNESPLMRHAARD